MTVFTGPAAIAQRAAFFSGRSGAIYQIGPYHLSPDDIEHGVLRANLPHPSQITAARTNNATIPQGYFPDRDPRSALSLSRSSFDARIHFILNCGAMSCPPIKVLTHHNAKEAMTLAASSYLMNEVSLRWMIDEDSASTNDQAKVATNNKDDDDHHHPLAGVIYLPRLLLWYGSDFGSDLISVMRRVVDMLPQQSSVRLQLCDLLTSGTAVFYSDDDSSSSSAIHVNDDVDNNSSTVVEGETCRRYFKVEYNSYDWSFNGSGDD